MSKSTTVNSEGSISGGSDSVSLILNKLDNIQMVIDNNTADLAAIKTELTSFKAEVNKSFQQVNKDIMNSKKEIIENKKQTKMLNRQMTYVNQQIIEFSQIPFQNYVRIDNIPFKENENLMDIIKTIAKVINVKLNEDSIDFVYRQKIKSVNGCPSIILKFITNSLKTKFIIHSKQNKNKLKAELFEPNATELIYVNEYLSSLKYNVLRKAKSYKKEGYLHSVWNRNGKIWIRLLENSQPQSVSTLEDLFGFIGFENQKSTASTYSEEEAETDEHGTDSSSINVGLSRSGKKRKLKRTGLGNMKSFLVKKESQVSTRK